MSYGISPQCFDCRRLRGIVSGIGWSCEAFDDRPIPKDILVNAADHREPYLGDNGLRFVDKDVLSVILARIDTVDKTSKETADYVDHPVDGDQCSQCKMFVAPNSCTAVDGVISFDGHCKYFERLSEIEAAIEEDEIQNEDSLIRAAGIMFLAPDNSVLMLRRTDQGTMWDFPGGVIEDGETVEEAARREAIEEVGPHYYGDLEPWTRRVKDGVDFTTFRQHVPERFEPVLNGEHDAFEWVNLEDMKS